MRTPPNSPGQTVKRLRPRDMVAAAAMLTAVVDLSTKYFAANFAPPYLGRGGRPLGLVKPLTNPSFSLGVANASPTFSVLLMFMALAAGILFAGAFLRTGRAAPWTLGLALGGAAANTADRAIHGAVRDFIMVGPIVLNIADLAVFAGLAALALRISRNSAHKGQGAGARSLPRSPSSSEGP